MNDPLCNRVRPDGEIVAVRARGTFTGNRGIIHDPSSRTLLRRRWTTRAWITCALEFRGRRRAVMSGRTWTELFFLDEVTALAAGHRPCYYCRRSDAQGFAAALCKGLGVGRLRAPDIDHRLHGQRWASAGRCSRCIRETFVELPDGVMVMSNDVCYALRGDLALPWSAAGYGTPMSRQSLVGSNLALITPETTCQALSAGYRPVWHSSA